MLKCYKCYEIDTNKTLFTLEEYKNPYYPNIKIYSADIEKFLLFKIKSEDEFITLYKSWRAFCINPEKYRHISKIVSAWFENIINK